MFNIDKLFRNHIYPLDWIIIWLIQLFTNLATITEVRSSSDKVAVGSHRLTSLGTVSICVR